MDLFVLQRSWRGAGAERREFALRGDRGLVAFDRAIGRSIDIGNDGGRATHDVLKRLEGKALAADLLLSRSAVRIGIEVRTGVHHRAELGEQHHQRQHRDKPAAIGSDQNGLRG